MHTLIIFDLDDTLAESKAPISPLMADSIARLLMRRQVAIITGGKYEQILKQVVTHLPVHADFSRLHLFPTCGAAYFRFLSGKWENVYFERLTEENIKKISKALLTAQEQAGVITEGPMYGEQIEDRDAQVSWSALGQLCPGELKKKWDPDQKKRLSMLPFLEVSLPDFDVKIGGATTIDVTKKGVNKAYGIKKMNEYLKIPLSEMFFVGDAIFPGGNDYAAVETGIAYKSTRGPETTREIIEGIIREA